ncbi:polyprenyl synthetase family protein [Nonomuraea sp. NPDC050404]|uniref:polyprenyl synthetase family protein n=1 Tax=Nonomuraea sp. NPDC050404 TaxID=3155783 RepID=UPI0033EC2082
MTSLAKVTQTPRTTASAEKSATHAAAGILERTRRLIEPAHRAVIDGFPAEIRRIAGYHIGWWDSEGRPTGTTGKALRPALTLACARAAAAGNASAEKAATAAAVAVELVHDFSLLHDDVMDGGLTRRHRPAAWAVFGTAQAVLTGDLLLTTAIQHVGAAAEPGGGAAVKVLAAAVRELCVGQSQDLAFERSGAVGLAECLEMAEAKTGTLMGAACELGALAAGAGPAVALSLREFGRELGLAFQLVDDLLGIWGDGRATGKPVRSDLASRKKSLPVVAALTSGTPAGERLAGLYDRPQEPDTAWIEQAACLIERAGGRRWAAAEARRRLDAALRALRRAHPAPAAAADLEALAMVMTRRDR